MRGEFSEEWHQRLEELFYKALDLPASERRRLIADQCANDPGMRQKVETLLAEDARQSRSLPPLLARVVPLREDLPEGSQVGPYHIVRLLGEGGFGVVYEAEQTEPLRRRVALKILKAGVDTRQVVARFERERQCLASLEHHPNIAGVLDAGETDRGRPYVVMELVDGEPITWFADRHCLTITDRLMMFVDVARAVQHAHQKGIIHRDLKPSNVLVTELQGIPCPKVIDFGIAKAIGNHVVAATLQTDPGLLLGTPEYMSPEQLFSSTDDTRTDVYALGVILYELLTGTLPFKRGQGHNGLLALVRAIQEEDAPPPSRSVSTAGNARPEIAAQRRTSRVALVQRLRSDLDWIVLKALDKELERRYHSVGELEADIQRHLTNRPVLARAPELSYRVRKFAQRHRAVVVAAGVGGGAIVLGISAMAVGIVQANRARKAARREAATANATLAFLERIFRVANPGQSHGSTVTARALLDEGAAQVERELGDEPFVKSRLLQTLGNVYRNLGLYDQARPFLERALLAHRTLLGERDLHVAQALNDLAILEHDTGDHNAARGLHLEALAIRESKLGRMHPDVAVTLNNLANQEGVDDRRALYERALAIREQRLGPDDPLVASTLNNLAMLLSREGDFDGAIAHYERALAILEKAHGPAGYQTMPALMNLGVTYSRVGNYERALEFYERAVAIQEAELGPDHPTLGKGLVNLAKGLSELGRYDKAEPLLNRALRIQHASLGQDHPDVATTLNNLGDVRFHRGDYDSAGTLFERALLLRERRFGVGHPEVALTLTNRAAVSTKRGDFDGAKADLERALEIWIGALGAEHPYVGTGLFNLAELHYSTNAYDSACTLFERALAVSEDSLGASHPDVVEVLERYAEALRAAGRGIEAESVGQRAKNARAEISMVRTVL